MENEVAPTNLDNQPISQSEIVTPNNSSPSKSKLSFIIIGVVLLIIFTLGGIFIGKNLYSSKTFAPLPTIAPEQTVIPTTTSDETADWKTFTGVDWSFKYPSNLFAKETTKNFVDLVDTENTPGSNARVSIDARLVAPYLDNYDTALKRRVTDLNIINPVTTTLSNGVIISGKLGPGMGEGLQVTNGLIKYKNGAISIQYNDDNIDSQTFAQILSTFKFTDQSSSLPKISERIVSSLDTSSWLLVSDPSGYKFKYPSSWFLNKSNGIATQIQNWNSETVTKPGPLSGDQSKWDISFITKNFTTVNEVLGIESENIIVDKIERSITKNDLTIYFLQGSGDYFEDKETRVPLIYAIVNDTNQYFVWHSINYGESNIAEILKQIVESIEK